MALQIDIYEIVAGVSVIALAGRLDSDTFADLDAEIGKLLETSPLELVLNMAEVDYISSAGVRVIYSTKKKMMEAGGDLILVDLQPPVRKVFEVINALPVFKVFRNLAELDDYLDSVQLRATGDTADG